MRPAQAARSARQLQQAAVSQGIAVGQGGRTVRVGWGLRPVDRKSSWRIEMFEILKFFCAIRMCVKLVLACL